MADEGRLANPDSVGGAAGRYRPSDARLPGERVGREADGGEEARVPGAPPPEPAAAPSEEPTPPAGQTRDERVRALTAAGGFRGAVPDEYKDGADWETIRSAEDPFLALHLDYRQAAAVSPEILAEHRRLLGEFWRKRVDQRNQGAGGLRERLDARYGRDLAQNPERVEAAFLRLTAPGGVEREAAALHAERRARGEAELAKVVEPALADGVLNQARARALLRRGQSLGLSAAEAAGYLVRVLKESGFSPLRKPAGVALEEVVLSTDWATEEGRVGIRPPVPPFKFRSGAAATTLPELIDLCDWFPDEAQSYLANETFERWLATVGEAGAADVAHKRRRANPARRDQALELFVRDLSVAAGRPVAPVLAARTAECVLGELPVGARAAARLEFEHRDRPLVWGTARRAGTLPGLTVPETFEGGPHGAAAVTVEVDTVDVKPGSYAGEVVVAPEGGAPASARVRYTVLPLALVADHPKLALGTLPFGETRRAKVRVATTPAGGRLVGGVSLAGSHPGVSVTGGVRGAGAEAEVVVDTRQIGVGQRLESALRFETNAGVLEVPLTLRVRGAGASAARWAAGLGAAVGGAMWLARGALRDREPALGTWYLVHDGMTRDQSLLLALLLALVPAVLLLLALHVVRRR